MALVPWFMSSPVYPYKFSEMYKSRYAQTRLVVRYVYVSLVCARMLQYSIRFTTPINQFSVFLRLVWILHIPEFIHIWEAKKFSFHYFLE
jgi:hypothetical protein